MDANLFFQNHGVVTVPNPDYNPKSKKNKGPKTIDIVDLSANRNQLNDIVQQDLLHQERISAKKAETYEKYGINWNAKEASNGSLDVQLADAQSNWAKFGNALAQTIISEIGLGTALGISDLFDAIGQATGISDHDYNNPVSAKLEEWQDKFNNEVAPIYSKPGSGFGNGTDFGWWMQNIPSIASSLTLLIPAAGATKAVSLVGKGIAKTTRAGAKWIRNIDRAKKVAEAGHVIPVSSRFATTAELFAKNGLTAAFSRTMENYQEARQVYDDMYVDVLDRLNSMDDEEYQAFLSRNQNTLKDVDTTDKDEIAKTIARKSADKTFKEDYANTVFDLIQLYALRNVAFHGFRNTKLSAAARRLDKNSRRFAGKYKTMGELEELVNKQSFGRKAADKLGDILYSGRTIIAAQASEGVEEAINYIAQQEGMHLGHTMLGMEANTTFSNRLEQYMNAPELWESAFWGVAGGIIFQGGGSGLARLQTAYERKQEHKKKKANEKTGEDVEASIKGTAEKDENGNIKEDENTKIAWKELMELPDVKRAKTAIERRLANEVMFEARMKALEEDNTKSNEEKQILEQQYRDERRTSLLLNAMDSGTIDMLREYIADENVKQALIDKGLVKKEDADKLQQEDLRALETLLDNYDDNVKTVNRASRHIYRRTGKVIPVEYLQLIARNNIAYGLQKDNLTKRLNDWNLEADNMYQKLLKDNKLDPNLNYKELIQLETLTTILSEYETQKREILTDVEKANSISGQERLRELNKYINKTRKAIYDLNAENAVPYLLYGIEQSFSAERGREGGLDFIGSSKDYLEFRTNIINENANYFKEIDERLANIQESDFHSRKVVDQKLREALSSGEYSLQKVSAELGEAYKTISGLEHRISMLDENINEKDDEIEQEANHIHNYLNEVRRQKIEDSVEQIKGLADKYGKEAIRDLVTNRYHGEPLDFTNINMNEQDKDLLNEALDTLNLDDNLNDDIANAVDTILENFDDIREAERRNAELKSGESSFASENQNTDEEKLDEDNPLKNSENLVTDNKKGQNEEVEDETEQQPAQTPSGLNTQNIKDGKRINYKGDYIYHSIPNSDNFEVEFRGTKNVIHFNNPNLFSKQEGVVLADDNYMIGKNPIIDIKGNVIEKGLLVQKTPENEAIVAQEEAEEKAIREEAEVKKQQDEISSTGDVGLVIPPKVTEDNPVVDNTGAKQSGFEFTEDEVHTQVYNSVMKLIKTNQDVEGSSIDWDVFRREQNEKFNNTNGESKYITDKIEQAIRSGKDLAKRRNIKSVDAVIDVAIQTSRLSENINKTEEELKPIRKEYADAVKKLLDVFNDEIGLDVIGNKRYINVEAICRYCNKVFGDKIASRNFVQKLINLVENDNDLTATDVNVQEVSNRLNDIDNSKEQYLGIDFNSILKEISKNKDSEQYAKFCDVIDNIQIGDKLEIRQHTNENGTGGIYFYKDGIRIGTLPFPVIMENGGLYQNNNGWKTDITITSAGIESKLKNLFYKWTTELDNPDIKRLNEIIITYAYSKNDKERRKLIDEFEENNEIKKAINSDITLNKNPEVLLEGISKIWRFVRSKSTNPDQAAIDNRILALDQWFERVRDSFNFIDSLRKNDSIQVEIANITEGSVITTDIDNMIPSNKAIGTYYKDKVRLGIIMDAGIMTLAGNGINGSNKIVISSFSKDSTFVVIPTRDGNHAYIHAYPQKVNSDSISKTAKDIKNAIYSEISRICSDTNLGDQERVISLRDFIKQILPAYNNGAIDKDSGIFNRNIVEKTNINFSPRNKAGGAEFTIFFKRTGEIKNSQLRFHLGGTFDINGKTVKLENLADTIKGIIEDCCTFNLNYNAISSDIGGSARQNLTRKGKNGEFIVSIPNQGNFTFNSYNDFVIENGLVLVRTKPSADGKSNFNRVGDDLKTTQQITVKISDASTSPVEESEQETDTIDIAVAPEIKSVLDIINSTKIKNKGEKLADLLLGTKIRKRLKFNNKDYRLFPKNIIFVDTKLGVNAITNDTNSTIIDDKYSGIKIPSKTTVLGREWLEKATSKNEELRKEAVKKLIHEQIHILLTEDNNSKYIEQIREVFNEFEAKNNNPNLEQYLFKNYPDYHNEDGSLNTKGLEDFLVETLTSRELAEGLNNIKTDNVGEKGKKESLLQRIMKLICNILGIDIKSGSLYEKEFNLLRDVLDTKPKKEVKESESVVEKTKENISQLELNFDEQVEEEKEELNYDIMNNVDAAAEGMGFDDLDFSRLSETINEDYTSEMQEIKAKAIADGTFMKAPNGKPTNLNERQWLQVRTKAFKDWFGDWERVTNINNISNILEEASNEEKLQYFENEKNELNALIDDYERNKYKRSEYENKRIKNEITRKEYYFPKYFTKEIKLADKTSSSNGAVLKRNDDDNIIWLTTPNNTSIFGTISLKILPLNNIKGNTIKLYNFNSLFPRKQDTRGDIQGSNLDLESNSVIKKLLPIVEKELFTLIKDRVNNFVLEGKIDYNSIAHKDFINFLTEELKHFNWSIYDTNNNYNIDLLVSDIIKTILYAYYGIDVSNISLKTNDSLISIINDYLEEKYKYNDFSDYLNSNKGKFEDFTRYIAKVDFTIEGKIDDLIKLFDEASKTEDNLSFDTDASKVVDENGEPLVVYRGEKEKYNIKKSVSFFTTDRNYASSYGNVDSYFLNIKKLMHLKRGIDFDTITGQMQGDEIALMENPNYNIPDGYYGNDTKNRKIESSGIEFVTTNPNQIKSATDNNGEFSRTNDNIKTSRLSENSNKNSISTFINSFPLQEQPKVISDIENGEISITCK